MQQSFENLDISKLDKDFLNSPEFLELLERSIEINAKTSSDIKRKLVADYLSGVIETSVINDIHGQLLEDLNSLQEFHLQIIATLPDKAWTEIQKSEQLSNMPDYIFEKALSDLERFGFLVSKSVWDDDGINSKFTTEYLVKFKKTFKNFNE